MQNDFTFFFGALTAACACSVGSAANAQAITSPLSLDSDFTSRFDGVSIAGAVDLSSNISAGSGQITQIAFAPGDDTHAYVSTFENGIWRYDYDPSAANFLSNGIKIVPDSILESPSNSNTQAWDRSSQRLARNCLSR